MNRRSFLKHGSRIAAAAPLAGALARFAPIVHAQTIPAAVMARIGMTTVVFRDRFMATRPTDTPPPAEGLLTAMDTPRFFADTFGIHNVEIWNRHFDDMSIDYARRLRAVADATGSRITNIQLDGQYDLSAADEAQRTQAIAFVKGWMDRAAAVGAPRMRANPGGRRGDEVPERTIDSFRQLAAHGKAINVKILVENHNGMSVEIPKTVEIVRRVNDPFCRALSDWGNTPSGSPDERVSGLREMLPLIEFVSAKQVDFDGQNRHVSYDIVPLIRATEASGYRGIYSIEFFGQNPPTDTVAAVRAMMRTLADNIKG